MVRLLAVKTVDASTQIVLRKHFSKPRAAFSQGRERYRSLLVVTGTCYDCGGAHSNFHPRTLLIDSTLFIYSRTAEEPQLHWLRDSGQIKRDADQMIFLWPSREPDVADSMREIRWKVAKNRDGVLNHGRLNFQTMYCRFVETIVGAKAA